MFKKIIVIISLIFCSYLVNAQKDINSYKYILVPKAFDFSKSDDQYQLNSIAKFLFNKYGYKAYFPDDDLPEDLLKNRCLALTAQLSNENNSMLKTKVEFLLKDCFGVLVMKSKLGESRLKKYDRAYNEAMRDAFETFQNFDYKYIAGEEELTETLKSETTALKEEKPNILENASIPNVNVKSETEQAIVLATSGSAMTKAKTAEIKNSEIYYAQEIENGFQLVDSQPSIVMILLITSAENVFLVKGKSAIVFKEEGFWYYSENDGKLDEKQSLNIKF